MSRSKAPVLNEKHLKALALIEQGTLSLKDIAKECGWKPDYLYDLNEGDTSKAGEVASFFTAEVKKIGKKRNLNIESLSTKNMERVQEEIARILADLKKQKYLSLDDQKLVATLMNCLTKATPNVLIDELSYSYTKGYTPEQMLYEYKRLKTLAGGAPQRCAVQEADDPLD